MMKRVLVATILSATALSAGAATNVAQGAGVTLSGSNFGLSPGWSGGSLAAASSVVDGVFLPNATQWNIGSVFWSGPTLADTISIALAQPSIISSLTLQADNNDQYAISYRDVGGTWHDLTTISPGGGYGLQTFSTPIASITATAFQIKAAGGDSWYAVSEFQAIGAPVPEPETYALMLAGLAGLAFARRRMAR